MRRLRTQRFVWISAVAMLLVGCVANPYDGERIANHPTTIIPTINGFGTSSNQTVTVFAKDSAGNFDAVATTTTASNGLTWNDSEWYFYSLTDLDLPTEYWEPKNGGACGAKATLKVKIGSSAYGMSLKEPFNDCFEFDMETGEFVEECASDNSPEFTIDTCGPLCC